MSVYWQIDARVLVIWQSSARMFMSWLTDVRLLIVELLFFRLKWVYIYSFDFCMKSAAFCNSLQTSVGIYGFYRLHRIILALEAKEMWFFERMIRKPWAAKVTDNAWLKIASESRTLYATSFKKKTNLIQFSNNERRSIGEQHDDWKDWQWKIHIYSCLRRWHSGIS